MLTHRGFSAWITVDDQLLPEYLAAVDSDAHRVSCWIPGEEGQTFRVWWQDHSGKVDTCGYILLDGLVAPGRFLFGEGITSRASLRVSQTTEKPFMFAKVPAHDTEAKEYNQDAGTLVLKIKRVKRVMSRPSNLLQQVGDIAASGKRKVGDLCIGFGEERTSTPQYPVTWSILPYDDDVPGSTHPSTYVSFVFRYRSADFLESQGIATEVKKHIAPRVGEKRRVASLPSDVVAGPLVTPSPSPPKRPRLTEPLRLPSIQSAVSRKPPSDLRRTVSWKDLPPGLVYLPRLQSLGISSSSSSVLHTPVSASSETPTLSSDDDELDKHHSSFSSV